MEFTFKVNEGQVIHVSELGAGCAGPIVDFAHGISAYTEYFFPIENDGIFTEEELITWINYLNELGFNILYCGRVHRQETDKSYYLCVIHNELLAQAFPKLNANKYSKLNLMVLQALRYIQYYKDIVKYAYEISKIIKDKFLSLQLGHVYAFYYSSRYNEVYGYWDNNYLSGTYCWIFGAVRPRLLTLEQFREITHFGNIIYIFDYDYPNFDSTSLIGTSKKTQLGDIKKNKIKSFITLIENNEYQKLINKFIGNE